eukprot:scaffold19663_cov58-Phaeocystis_antarctica.AAC.1
MDVRRVDECRHAVRAERPSEGIRILSAITVFAGFASELRLGSVNLRKLTECHVCGGIGQPADPHADVNAPVRPDDLDYFAVTQ